MMPKHIMIIILGLLVASCNKDPALWKIENLNGNEISVFGHGGMGNRDRYPMDSYESLQQCLSLGADGTEMDVQLTADSALVLYHNEKLEELTKCSGEIRSKTWDELKNCSYSMLLASELPLIGPTYLLDRVENKKNLIFTFDCKVLNEDDPAYLNRFANALVALIEKYDLVSNCFIESFNVDFLKLLHKKNKDLRLFLYTSAYQTGLEYLDEVKLYGLVMDRNKISKEEIQDAHRNNLRITLFNLATEKENIEAIEKSPDFMQTDQVEYMLKVFGKYKN